MDMTPGQFDQIDDDEQLLELILAWEDANEAGLPITPAELCRTCPEMIGRLEQSLVQLNQLDRLIFSDSDPAQMETMTSAPILRSPAKFPTLPGYDVLDEIGRGGMGVVYKARQASLNRLVAIKTLPGSRWGASDFVSRLRKEAHGLSLLNHPNVVKVFDIIETPMAAAIVLEYIEGESLSNRMKRSIMPPSEAVALMLDLARTMIVVHARGLLHRDIKPANILLDVDGKIRVADFGLVKEQGDIGGLTETGQFFGTPNYMAPEQAEGRAINVDVRTDIYAMGATLYEILVGRPPFVGVSILNILDQIKHQDPVRPRLLNSSIPPDLETICVRCLEKQPERRFQTAKELADELERFQKGVPILSRQISQIEKCRRWCRRRPAIASLAVISFASVVAILFLFASNHRNLQVYNQELTSLNNSLTSLNEDLEITAIKAARLQQASEESERRAKGALYVSDISRAGIAWRQDDTRDLRNLLVRHIPKEGEPDRRGFEWWYLNRLAMRSHQTLLDTGATQYFMRLSPDRKRMLVVGSDAIVRLFDSVTGELVKQFATNQIEVNSADFSPDGTELATAGDDGTIRIWNLEAAAERLNFKVHPGKIFQVLFTFDGSKLISCGDNPLIRVSDSQTGSELFTLEGHDREVQSLKLDEDGITLISSGNDHKVKRWNLNDKSEIDSYESAGDIGTFVYDRNRNLLFTGDSQGELHVYNFQNKTTIESVKTRDKIVSIALDPSGNLLAAGDHSGQIHLRTLGRDGKFVADQNKAWYAHEGVVYSLVWSADGTRLLSTGGDGRVLSWSPTSGLPIDSQEYPLQSDWHFSLIHGTNSLLIKPNDNSLLRWNWLTGQTEGSCSSEFLYWGGTSFDGSIFASVAITDTKNDRLFLYDFPSDPYRRLDENFQVTWEPDGSLTNLHFSPDAKSIAISRWHQKDANQPSEHFIWLVNISRDSWENSRKESTSLLAAEKIPVPFANDSAFSPDGRRLALMTDMGLVHWNISRSQVDWRLPKLNLKVVAYSPDASTIVIGGSDRMILIVNPDDGTILHQLANHRGEIRSLSFSPDGRLLASASSDGAIKLWHIASGQELLEFPHGDEDAWQVQFSDTGNHLICLFRSRGMHTSNRLAVFNGSPGE